MTTPDNEAWIINIQNAASDIAAHPFGSEIVLHVLSNFGAKSIEDLSPAHYSEAFDELDYIATDLRN